MQNLYAAKYINKKESAFWSLFRKHLSLIISPDNEINLRPRESPQHLPTKIRSNQWTLSYFKSYYFGWIFNKHTHYPENLPKINRSILWVNRWNFLIVFVTIRPNDKSNWFWFKSVMISPSPHTNSLEIALIWTYLWQLWSNHKKILH